MWLWVREWAKLEIWTKADDKDTLTILCQPEILGIEKRWIWDNVAKIFSEDTEDYPKRTPFIVTRQALNILQQKRLWAVAL